MIQRIQTMWMALTVAMVCIAGLNPVMNFSLAESDFRLMTYGLKQQTGEILVLGGEEGAHTLTSPTLAICLATLLALAAIIPLVTIFLFKNRQLQMRLLGAEFGLLVGAVGLMGWYIWKYYHLVAAVSDNYFLSLFPLLVVVALITNYLAVRGVMADEMLVRAADRVR